MCVTSFTSCHPLNHTNKQHKSDNKQKKQFTFNDFFHLDSLDKEHEGIDIITMEEFLSLEEAKNILVDYETGKPLKPPFDCVNWNGQNLKPLWDYLRKVGHVRTDWHPSECTAAIPASKGPNDIAELERMMEEINAQNIRPEDFKGKPFPVDAPTIDRLKENSCERKRLCIYDEEMQNAPLVHFQVGIHESKTKLRLLTHFYSFVFFQDWRQDLWAKRFVRDHIRYLDEIMCAAARVANAVREKAKSNPNGLEKNLNGEFDALHVRRGDFQYKKTRLEADELLQRTLTKIEKGTTLFIATDERQTSFFDPFKEHYSIYFLDDFKHLLKDINTNHFGMIGKPLRYFHQLSCCRWWTSV